MKVCLFLALLLSTWSISEAATSTQPPPPPTPTTPTTSSSSSSLQPQLPPIINATSDESLNTTATTPTSTLANPTVATTSTTTLLESTTPAQDGREGSDSDETDEGGPPPPPPPPVWAECLSRAPPEASASLPALFHFWCSNLDQIIPCLAAGLPTEAAGNPLDQFVKLYFDSELMKNTSSQLCQNFLGLGGAVQCTQANNVSVEQWCHARFAQGQQYVFAMMLQRAFDDDISVYRQLACQVIEDTTGCLGTAMTGCDVETKRHLLAFYAFFTNESCLADPSDTYVTPAPPPPRPAPPRDVVMTCAQRIEETVPMVDPLPRNASHLDQLLFGLQHNCRTFEARYSCYDEELNKITSPSFRDIWLSFTFNTSNAIHSQRQFCLGFEGGIADSLTADCYNETRPLLQQCEEDYGEHVMSTQAQWLNDRLDNVGLHKAACRTSLQRAFCLRNAFLLCGVSLAESMLVSEVGTLPDICLSLLPVNNDDDDDDNDDSDDNNGITPDNDDSDHNNDLTPDNGTSSSELEPKESSSTDANMASHEFTSTQQPVEDKNVSTSGVVGRGTIATADTNEDTNSVASSDVGLNILLVNLLGGFICLLFA